MKKTFYIELEDSLTYPDAQTICALVERYAENGKETPLEWVSREKPVSFYLGGHLYQTEIGMIRGGYQIDCKEI